MFVFFEVCCLWSTYSPQRLILYLTAIEERLAHVVPVGLLTLDPRGCRIIIIGIPQAWLVD